MNLREKFGMIIAYLKKKKKSIDIEGIRLDLFLIIALLVLVVCPLIVNLFLVSVPGSRQVQLFVSSRSEEFFGKEITAGLLREFKDKNPDIRIQLLPVLDEKGREADILIFDDEDFSALVAAGITAQLNSFTNYDSGFPQMAVPLVSFMDLLFYNIDILSAAGFDRPPKTREEFTAYAGTVSGGNINGVSAGAAISLSTKDRRALSRDIFSWIWAAGGNYWSGESVPDDEELSVLPPSNGVIRALVNDFNFFGALNRENVIAPRIFNTTGDQRIEEFAQRGVAMMIASSRAIPYLRARMGDDAFGITTIPAPSAGGRYNIGLSAIYAGLNANSAHLNEAWRFIEFLTEKAALLCEELKAIPGAISNLTPGEYARDDPFYSKAWDIFEASHIIPVFSGKPGADEYEAAFMEEIRAFLEGRKTAQEAVNAILEKWERL